MRGCRAAGECRSAESCAVRECKSAESCAVRAECKSVRCCRGACRSSSGEIKRGLMMESRHMLAILMSAATGPRRTNPVRPSSVCRRSTPIVAPVARTPPFLTKIRTTNIDALKVRI